MKLNRKQELALIDLGLQQLLKTLKGGSGNHLNHKGGMKRGPYRKSPWNKGKKGSAWTLERRKKFSETMKKKWADTHKKTKK